MMKSKINNWRTKFFKHIAPQSHSMTNFIFPYVTGGVPLASGVARIPPPPQSPWMLQVEAVLIRWCSSGCQVLFKVTVATSTQDQNWLQVSGLKWKRKSSFSNDRWRMRRLWLLWNLRRSGCSKSDGRVSNLGNNSTGVINDEVKL